MARARRFRHRITFERSTAAEDSHGQAIKSWSTLTTRWAEIKPVKGGERTEAQRTQGEISHMIAIRFDPALIITTADRIVHESRTFEIKGLHQEHEDRRTIILECLESTT